MNGRKSLQWCRDSNPQYLGVESASLTTRPRLLALSHYFDTASVFALDNVNPRWFQPSNLFSELKKQHVYGKSSAFETIRMLTIKNKIKSWYFIYGRTHQSMQ